LANDDEDRQGNQAGGEKKLTRGFIAEEVGDLIGDIMKELRNSNRQPLKTVHDLALLIISRCTQLFLRADVVRHEKLRFLEHFKTRIARVVGGSSFCA
jgi:hypothetical protein